MSRRAFLNSSSALLPPQGQMRWKVPIGNGKASSARPSELLDPALGQGVIYLRRSTFHRRPFRERAFLGEDPPRTCALSSQQRRFSAATIPGGRHKSENGQSEERQILRLGVAPPRQSHSAFENGIFWSLLFGSAETFREVSAPDTCLTSKKRASGFATAQDSPQPDCLPGQYSTPQSFPADSSIMYRLKALGDGEFSTYSQQQESGVVFLTIPYIESSLGDSQVLLPDSMFPQLRLSNTDSSSTHGGSCSSKGGASGPPAWPLRTPCATRRRYVIQPNGSSRSSFPASNETLHSFNRRRPCYCKRIRHPCRRVVPDSLLGSPTTSTQKLRPTGCGCATDQATWTRPAQKISPCRSYKPYRSCRRVGSTRSPPPSLPGGGRR